MNFMRFGVLAGVVLAAGCGGSSSDEKAPRDPYVEFRVNGFLDPKEISLNWVEASPDATDRLCDPDVYENGETVATSEPDYCTQSFGTVTFSVRFTNPTYSTINVSYLGYGFEVQVYEYDELAADFRGKPVWNSSYALQRQIIGYRDANAELELDDFDPDTETTVALASSDSIPNYASFNSVVFDTHQIFQDGTEDYRAYSPEEIEANLRAMKHPATQDCDFILQPSETDLSKARFVQCLGAELLPDPGTTADPVKFVASVTFNFNGWTEQPDDIIITVNPPE